MKPVGDGAVVLEVEIDLALDGGVAAGGEGAGEVAALELAAGGLGEEVSRERDDVRGGDAEALGDAGADRGGDAGALGQRRVRGDEEDGDSSVPASASSEAQAAAKVGTTPGTVFTTSSISWQ